MKTVTIKVNVRRRSRYNPYFPILWCFEILTKSYVLFLIKRIEVTKIKLHEKLIFRNYPF